jgi:hypothetical protein
MVRVERAELLFLMVVALQMLQLLDMAVAAVAVQGMVRSQIVQGLQVELKEL